MWWGGGDGPQQGPLTIWEWNSGFTGKVGTGQSNSNKSFPSCYVVPFLVYWLERASVYREFSVCTCWQSLNTSFSSVQSGICEAEREPRGVSAVLLLYPSPQLACCMWDGFYRSLFNPLPIEGCLPCFQFEDSPNKVGGTHQCLLVMM